MDISTLLETAIHGADSVANAANHLGDTIGNLTTADIKSDCCSSNNYPEKPPQ